MRRNGIPRLLADPPRISEHHLRLPDEPAKLLNAASAHGRGITGKGTRIAIIDSGFFPHPYFLKRGYRLHHIPTSREPRPDLDEYGHGTANLASIFALAPDADVLAIKCMDRDPSAAISAALRLDPHIITCAWGFDADYPRSVGRGGFTLPKRFHRMYSILREAVERGITVVVAAGNGQRAFPGSMPEVISVGGIFYGPDGAFVPSNASSRFTSSFFPRRIVPDVCGLAGQLPYGRLLLVPVPPNARLAKRVSFGAAVSPSKPKPGWAMFSGTSAATAMVAGAAAILLQSKPSLQAHEIKKILLTSARVIFPKENNSKNCPELLIDVQAALAHTRL